MNLQFAGFSGAGGSVTTAFASNEQRPAQSPSAAQLPAEHLPAPYKMSRALVTVRELWTEWTMGLNGERSIISLEEEFGTAWRRALAIG